MLRVFLSAPSGFVIACLGLSLGACAGNDRPSASAMDEMRAQMRPRQIVQPIALVLSSYDADLDAQLTRVEADAGMARAFAAADEDGDARLNGAEINAWLVSQMGSPYPVPGRLAFDPDGSQSVTPDEFAFVLNAAFTRLDANSDDILTRDELVFTFTPPNIDRNALRREMQQQMRRRGGGGMGGGMGGRGMGG